MLKVKSIIQFGASLFTVLALSIASFASEVVVKKNAVVRDGPHGYSKSLGKATPGDRFPLQRELAENNWYLIQYQGKDGWVYSKSVSIEQSTTLHDITIASFNTLHLGWGANKNFEIVASVLSRFDVIALQEVMKEDAVATLIAQLDIASTGPGSSGSQWNYVVSKKVGTPSYSESYAFVWKSDRVSLLPNSEFVYSDLNNEFVREPYVATFKAGNFDFTLVSAHFIFGKKLKERQDEAKAVARVFQSLQQADSHENDLILMGDFNLPPTDVGWQGLKDIAGITWVLNPPSLTTVGKTGMSSLYDNIWFQSQYVHEFTGTGGSYEYMHDFFETDIFENAKEFVSDHIPVYAVFRTDQADDD